MQIKHDRKLLIAIGRSRKASQWQNKEMLWSEFLDKIATTTRTRETVVEYAALPKGERDTIKDVGGFVGFVRVRVAADGQGFERKNRLRADVPVRADGVRGVFPAYAGGVRRFAVLSGSKRGFRRLYRRFDVFVRPFAKRGRVARQRLGGGNPRFRRRVFCCGGVLCRIAGDARFHARVFAD